MNETSRTETHTTLGFAPDANGSYPSAGASLAPKGEERAPLRSSRNGHSHGRAECVRAVSKGTPDTGPADERILLDVPVVAAALSRRLYAAGLPVTPERAVTFAEALTLIGPATRSQLYCTARTVFVSSPMHLPNFDLVFCAVFESGRPAGD